MPEPIEWSEDPFEYWAQLTAALRDAEQEADDDA